MRNITSLGVCLTVTWLTLNGSGATANTPTCQSGQQHMQDVGCVSQKLVDFIACVNSTGNNQRKVTEVVRRAASTDRSGRGAASIGNPAIRGTAGASLSQIQQENVVSELQKEFFPDGTSICKTLADSVASPTPATAPDVQDFKFSRTDNEIHVLKEPASAFAENIDFDVFASAYVRTDPAKCPFRLGATYWPLEPVRQDTPNPNAETSIGLIRRLDGAALHSYPNFVRFAAMRIGAPLDCFKPSDVTIWIRISYVIRSGPRINKYYALTSPGDSKGNRSVKAIPIDREHFERVKSSIGKPRELLQNDIDSFIKSIRVE